MRQLTFILILLMGSLCKAQTPITINYMDQDPPGLNTQVFAEGVISKKGIREGNGIFSPDGNMFLFIEVGSSGKIEIKQMTYQNNHWSDSKTISFSDKGDNWEPFFSQDGKTIYFVSNRSTGAQWQGTIWKTHLTGTTWSVPEEIPIPVAPETGLWFPTVHESKLYFGGTLDHPENKGKSDLYEYDMQTQKIKNLAALNSDTEDWDPFISADGSYLIFASDRKGGYGGVDHYISFRSEQGWGQPINLGPAINSEKNDVAAKVTPDGKYILFDRPEKDDQDIYWISTAVIDSLRVNH